jgi:hypothetical protein
MFEPRTFSRRTRQRFTRNREAELMRSLGREPSYPKRILISRIIAVEWDLRRIDARMDAGDELSGHAMRAKLAAENRLRLDLRELGLRPTLANEAAGTAFDRHIAMLVERQAAKYDEDEAA